MNCWHISSQETKTKLLMAFFLFLSFSLSASLTFLPDGVIVGFWNFEWGFKSQKTKILGELNTFQIATVDIFRKYNEFQIERGH